MPCLSGWQKSKQLATRPMAGTLWTTTVPPLCRESWQFQHKSCAPPSSPRTPFLGTGPKTHCRSTQTWLMHEAEGRRGLVGTPSDLTTNHDINGWQNDALQGARNLILGPVMCAWERDFAAMMLILREGQHPAPKASDVATWSLPGSNGGRRNKRP